MGCLKDGFFVYCSGYIKMRTMGNVMHVADETSTEKHKKQKTTQVKIAKRKFINWAVGVAISLLPILAIPFVEFISGASLCTTLYTLFCDISIMFVGISFTITAINDFIKQCIQNEEEGWVWLNVVLLLLGVVVYTSVVLVRHRNPDMDMTRVVWVNIIYFFVMFALSAIKYIKEIQEGR